MDLSDQTRIKLSQRAVGDVLQRMNPAERRAFADLMEGEPDDLRAASETQLALVKLLASVAFIQIMAR